MFPVIIEMTRHNFYLFLKAVHFLSRNVFFEGEVKNDYFLPLSICSDSFFFFFKETIQTEYQLMILPKVNQSEIGRKLDLAF
jgi:hypothetical protein